MKKWYVVAALLVALVWLPVAACSKKPEVPVAQPPAMVTLKASPETKRKIKREVRKVHRKAVAPVANCPFLWIDQPCP